jgi:hypothetical protein
MTWSLRVWHFAPTWIVVSLAPAFAACGESARGGGSASAGVGAAGGIGGVGGMSGGGEVTAGRASASGGTAAGGRGSLGGAGAGGGSGGSIDAAGAGATGRGGAGGSSGGGMAGAAGGGIGGGGAASGMGGVSQAGAGQGGRGQGGRGQGGRAQGGGAGDGCTVTDPPQSCSVLSAAYMAVVVDFSRYKTDGSWTSTSAGGITGSTSRYHSPGGSDLVFQVVSNQLHVTGTIPAGLHAGWVFAFDSCADSQSNLGFSFVTDGDLGGATLTLAVQTNADYPIDVSAGKGACALIDCDTKEPACKPPSALIPAPNGSLVYQGLGTFEGGFPESSVSYTTAIMGLEFDLGCSEDADCAVDFTLGMVKFFSA